MKRSGKFYRRNEAEIMRILGLEPTPNSGSGWIVKEDGQSDDIICQLKSTDAGSIKMNLQDIHTLQYNASVSHKVPVFAINFLRTNEVFLLIAPEDVQEALQAFCDDNQGNIPSKDKNADMSLLEASEEIIENEVNIIRSSDNARKRLREEMNGRYKKKGKSAL